jgi:hypothetical protein
MKWINILLALLAACFSNAHAAPVSTNSAPFNRILLVDSCSTPVAAGKATLIIGPLQRTNGTFIGEYRLKVFPYFFKNEKGRLVIIVSDETLAETSPGKVVAITGTATSDGKKGKSWPIQAIATPVDMDRGKLKLYFNAGTRKLIFESTYHFSGDETALAASQAPGMQP